MVATEEKRLWLFDLAHGNIKDSMKVVQGFIKHYVLQGRGTADVVQDIVFRTNYGTDGARLAKRTLETELEWFANRNFEETRTITEIRQIVESVRAGHNVQIAYADPDEDDALDPMITRPCY